MPVHPPGSADGHSPDTYRLRALALLAMIRSPGMVLSTQAVAKAIGTYYFRARYVLLTLAYEGRIRHTQKEWRIIKNG